MCGQSGDVISPKDVVTVHRFPSGKTIPNPSPFVLKVETYLRMAKVPYEIDTKKPTGPTGKSPWISLNGQNVGDSHLIIEFLKKKFGKNLNGSYTQEQIGVSTAVRIMLEEHFYWGVVLWRFHYGNDETLTKVMNLPPVWIVRLIVGRKVLKSAQGQGLGRHSKEDLLSITSSNLRAVSHILGDKKFILGEEPCENDAAIFGQLSQLIWGLPGSPYEKLIEDELPNIKQYCLRMKDTYWSDWDQCLDKKK